MMMEIGGRRLAGVIVTIILTASSAVARASEAPDIHGPIITPMEKEIILQNGENYTLYCRSDREIQFKQQEQAELMTKPFEIRQRIVPSVDDEEKQIALELFNVNEHAVGYYACFDNTINASDILILNSLKEEPSDTDHITYIYIYVNGSDHLFAPTSEIVTAKDDSVVVGCRPTAPDIKVELVSQQNNKYKKEKVPYLSKVGYLLKSNIKPLYKCQGRRGNDTIGKKVYVYTIANEKPFVSGNRYFLEGDTFTINCSVTYKKNYAQNLQWTIPLSGEDLYSRIEHDSNAESNIINGKLYHNITIHNATRDYAGTYRCSLNGDSSTPFEKTFLSEPFMRLERTSEAQLVTPQNFVKLQAKLNCYPPANVIFFKNSAEVIIDHEKYDRKNPYDYVELIIKQLNVYDTANYTMVVDNGYIVKNLTYDIRVIREPLVEMSDLEDKKYVVGSNIDNLIGCNVTAYPLNVSWNFVPFNNRSTNVTLESFADIHSLYQETSFVDLRQLTASGIVTCSTWNTKGFASLTRRVILYEVPDGFGIKDKDNTWFVQGDEVVLTCVGSLVEYDSLQWVDALALNIQYYMNSISHVAKLTLPRVRPEEDGQFTCMGVKIDGEEVNDSITITVEAQHPPNILLPVSDSEQDVYPYQEVTLSCRATGAPRPEIQWYKDDSSLDSDDNRTIIRTKELDRTTIESNLTIEKMNEDLGGKYFCVTRNILKAETSNAFTLIVHTKSANKYAYLSVIGVIFVILLILIVYLVFKIRKEKLFRKELAKAGLLYFKEGVPKSLNPDLGIDEQAELLPYDDRFEFPPEKLILGKQLGSGAFGVVYKADARGIVNAEETTTVAVKMVKKTADNLSIKALASELKIMVHMGKHINIVNLLGACTKNVGRRELSVIVEYCKFGNIHNYMIKHREVYIDQLNGNTEHNMGRVNRGFSCSSGNSGSHSVYFGSNHTQDTDHTFLNTAGSNRSGMRKVSESGYVQPMWRSNYESDYSYDGRAPRPLYSRDLLCWAFQIARGMEYLASRKVLHGDLAARNILLADDNIVKICDFGLARSVYKTDEYQKKENSPLPVKWLAIECMTDRIFSTQSDVWSYGIVLWELFTLAKTPYPNISPSELLPWLLAGKRLDKPRYADDRIFEVMLQCWEKKPTSRPTFSRLQEVVGSFLEDNVRNHYVDLNSAYLDMNIATKVDGQEDYLAMMRAPDYNNHVTPSPHEYVNDMRSFFPPTPTLQQDEEGYLQMSPANVQITLDPHTQQGKFDFDARKLNARSHEPTAHGSELTPMLTLNNLPARSGSESDHDNSSPYLNVCPRIEEETDEVFETKQNNIKNTTQSRAVTNPTYIAFDLDKKPQINSYVNVSNGLVN